MILEATSEALRVHDQGVTLALVKMVRADGMLTFYDLESESPIALKKLADAAKEIMKTERVYACVNGDNPKYERLIEFYRAVGFKPLTTILESK